MDNQNGYPVEIKDLEADQEQDGATINPICLTYLESYCERQELVESMQRGVPP